MRPDQRWPSLGRVYYPSNRAVRADQQQTEFETVNRQLSGQGHFGFGMGAVARKLRMVRHIHDITPAMRYILPDKVW